MRDLFPSAGFCRQEATMELSMRVSLIAALMSFGFIAAIVVGMV